MSNALRHPVFRSGDRRAGVVSAAASLLAHALLAAGLLTAGRNAQAPTAFRPPTGNSATIVELETDAGTPRGRTLAMDAPRQPAEADHDVPAEPQQYLPAEGDTAEIEPAEVEPPVQADEPRTIDAGDRLPREEDTAKLRGEDPSRRRGPSNTRKSEADSPSGQDGQRGEAGILGQKGLPPGVADLTKAFVKTLPLAAKSDDRWLRFPEGPAGSITVRLELDDEGHLENLVILDESPVPPHLKRLAELNQRFLARGQFAIAGAPARASQVLVIRATVERRARTKADSEGVHALGMRGQSPPTGAYFTYYSGQHVELAIEVIP